jgi:type I restriction enzyme S subunit
MKWMTYPSYKDSGIDWLGAIPEHWDMKRIKHISNFHIGWTPPTGRDEYYEGINLWANISDLGPKLLTDTLKRISDSAVRESRLRLSPRGSLLFSFKLSVGQVSIAGADMYTNEAIATFSPDSNTSLPYLYWAAPLFIPKNANENIYGAKLLNQELINNAKLAVPSITEQSKIATFLDQETERIDSLIAKKERQIELLQEKRAALISHAVTKGLNPNVKMKHSGIKWLGEIPAHWSVKRLKRISPRQSVGLVINPSTYVEDDGDVYFFFGADILEGHISTENARRISEDSNRIIYQSILKAGDLVTVRVGYPGVTAVVTPELEGSNCASVMITRGSKDFVSRWLCYAMNSKVGKSQVEIVQYGAAQKQFNIGHAVEFRFPVPPIEEQAAIESFLDKKTAAINHLIEQIRESIVKLGDYRTALISAAVTGKIDVRQEPINARA